MSATANPPGARRMALIALLSQNTGIGLMFGSFGPLIATVEMKLHVARDLSALGMPLTILGMSLMAPLAGALSGRVSLRLGMMVGAVLTASGYAVIAASRSIWQDLAAYGLLVGPGLALIGTVLPSTLVTRWFTVGAGRALGLVNMPLFVMLTPFLVVLVVQRFGLAAAYATLAAISLALLAPLWFVVDRPPGVALPTQSPVAAESGPTVGALLSRPAYWGLILAYAAMSTGGSTLVTHVAPMVMSWGLDPTRAASLVAVMGGAGVLGSVLFGAVADRIGGGFALALNCADQAVLWALLLTHPGYPMLLVIIGLIGIHSGAVISTLGVALAERFGAASFGRGYGLGALITLPLLVGGAPVAAAIFVHTHSYADALMLQIGLFALGAAAAVLASRGRLHSASPAAALRHP